ncbi:zinc-ribbon domain-containing protein [Paenibacillus elgii]
MRGIHLVKCERCGNEVLDNRLFCNHCGSKVGQTTGKPSMMKQVRFTFKK